MTIKVLHRAQQFVPASALEESARPGEESIGPGRPLGALLRLPLFAKLLIANGAIVLAAAAAARWVKPPGSADASLTLAVIAVVGLLCILGVNAAILWIALAPLRQLQHVAARVRAGDLDVRVPDSPLADRETRRLIQTYNDGLAAAARQRQRLREVQTRDNAATEAERERVAHALHDEIAQALTALRIRVRLARAARDEQLREAMLSEIGEGLGEAIHDLRRVAGGLRPVGLEMLGLAVAIEAYARPTAEAAGMGAFVNSDDVHGLLAPETELTLYRIVQEALSNAVRHSGASRVSIRMKRGEDHVALVIEDDGSGFNPTATDVGGLGLLDMQERVAALGGRFQIDSERGDGTRIEVLIPIPRAIHVC
ncbi:MAG: ATP-binding protein [Longimicrobiales bacterium]